MKLESNEGTYHSRVWEVMNELDMFPSKLIILKHLLESVQTSITNRDVGLAEYLLDATQDLVEHYASDFEKKFQTAWHQTLQIANVADEKSKSEADGMPPWGHSDLEYGFANSILTKDRVSNFPGEQYTEEELNAMCDAAESTKQHSAEAQLSDAIDDDDEYLQALSELNKNKTWIVPVEETPDGETLITFPDDLIKQVGWEQGDELEWIDNKDGSFTLKKKYD